ncbi:MAG: hypothetical protein JST32_16710 [Bacteroidetes bacterium]|nr:hypothetical protein [Bacteroidota bacterium]
MTASSVAQNILDQGAVLEYAKLGGIPRPLASQPAGQLPIELTYQLSMITYVDTWSVPAPVGNIQIDFTNDLNYYSGISKLRGFRYIVIPGGVPTLGSIDPKNYNQVNLALHLPD